MKGCAYCNDPTQTTLWCVQCTTIYTDWLWHSRICYGVNLDAGIYICSIQVGHA